MTEKNPWNIVHPTSSNLPRVQGISAVHGVQGFITILKRSGPYSKPNASNPITTTLFK